MGYLYQFERIRGLLRQIGALVVGGHLVEETKGVLLMLAEVSFLCWHELGRCDASKQIEFNC